ncbi:putative exonuclease [Emiliania huxleyi CCMP1516]|uniref:Endonuclease n=2 Tax=Emiliania huxleyi TaxID=2903 RepID=A0A0D3IWI0_EMIH1|nr:putative exonuclease [Emiliania huxleyi CCMP1516]EOD15615.1 putative exonuclease [Emiliania huxleyi CCMP1516]|eukprot:XP_005768044.1 putative exonuclease [Emiliania huxleyi CCMP1516]
MQRLAAAGFTAAGAVGGAAAAVLVGGASRPSKEEEPSPAALARRFCPYGLPSDEHVVVKQGYASSINFRLRIPNWVAEHYSRDQSDADGVDRKHSKFRADESVPADFRATNDDYRGSRLSRGHMAPAGAHKQSQEALDETFLLSANILPQELSNNGSDWLRLERWSRGLLKEYSDVYVVSGPLFLPDDSSAASDAPPPAAASAAAAASASPAVDASGCPDAPLQGGVGRADGHGREATRRLPAAKRPGARARPPRHRRVRRAARRRGARLRAHPLRGTRRGAPLGDGGPAALRRGRGGTVRQRRHGRADRGLEAAGPPQARGRLQRARGGVGRSAAKDGGLRLDAAYI